MITKLHRLISVFLLLLAATPPLYAQWYITPPVETNFADTIPIEFHGELVVVPVSINGKTHRFIFDTGMSFVMVKPNLLAEDAKIVHQDTIIDTNQRRQEIDFKELCELSIGKLHIPCCPVLPFDFEGSPFACAQIDGFIGGNILQHLSVKIDTRAKQLILTDRDNWFQAEKGFYSSMNIERNIPYINLEIGEVGEKEVMFDSGDNCFYSMCQDVFAQLKEFDQEVWKGEVIATTQGARSFGILGFAEPNPVSLIKLPEWKLNGIPFENVYTENSYSLRSHIGAKLFAYGQVILDYPNKQFTFIPYDDATTVTVADEGLNNIGMENGHIVISLIWEHTEAYQKGVRLGDRIIEINGKKIDDDICALIEALTDDITQLKVIDAEGNRKEFHFSPGSF